MEQEPVPFAPKLRASFTPMEKPDDLSSNAHRQLLGVLGIGLPLMIYLTAGWRGTANAPDRWSLLESISGYYHTGAAAVFIGIVVALGIFLITYDGYNNEAGWKDRTAARIAGCGALLLAFYPTKAEGGYPGPAWWSDSMGSIHFAGAFILFASFAYMAYFLFPMSNAGEDRGKRLRNLLHKICGITILACLIWAGIAGKVLKRPIFWPETVMLLAFGTSWLVKGKVDGNASALKRRVKRLFAQGE